MLLHSQILPAHSDSPGKIKQLYMRSASIGPEQDYAPVFYLEARIDFADVRSGYHMTFGTNSVVDILNLEDETPWTRDMVRGVNPEDLQTTKPEGARLRRLPDCVSPELLTRIETQYLTYLLRHTEVTVYRNFALNAYSLPGESEEEFQVRCLDLLNDFFRRDLDEFREVINRRLERIEQKFIAGDREGEFGFDRRRTQARSELRALAERITELFLQTELTLDGEVKLLPPADPELSDLEHRLAALETDVCHEIWLLQNSYQEKVRNIDEYLIHPNLRDLHLVRTGILWMPVGAPEP